LGKVVGTIPIWRKKVGKRGKQQQGEKGKTAKNLNLARRKICVPGRGEEKKKTAQ